MNKYEQIPEYILDLHGKTTMEAEIIVNDIIKQNIYKHIRIIVGKGNHSENGPVLPYFIKNYLSKNNIKYRQSKIKDGGEGSLEVFI